MREEGTFTETWVVQQQRQQLVPALQHGALPSLGGSGGSRRTQARTAADALPLCALPSCSWAHGAFDVLHPAPGSRLLGDRYQLAWDGVPVARQASRAGDSSGGTSVSQDSPQRSTAAAPSEPQQPQEQQQAEQPQQQSAGASPSPPPPFVAGAQAVLASAAPAPAQAVAAGSQASNSDDSSSSSSQDAKML